MDSFFSLNCPPKKVVYLQALKGIGHSSTWWIRAEIHLSSVLRLLLGLLQVSCWGLKRAPQALLENVGVCRLYPLVIVLFRFDDLKTELLVEIDCGLVADLHVTEGETDIKGLSLDGSVYRVQNSTAQFLYKLYPKQQEIKQQITVYFVFKWTWFVRSMNLGYNVITSQMAPINSSEQCNSKGTKLSILTSF